MRQSRSLRHRTSSLFPLCIESLHFDLIYPSTYIISLSPTWVFKLGSSIQATMSLQHCLKPIELSKTETSCQVVRTTTCGTNTPLQSIVSPHVVRMINQSSHPLLFRGQCTLYQLCASSWFGDEDTAYEPQCLPNIALTPWVF
jgi:hypothetical protein